MTGFDEGGTPAICFYFNRFTPEPFECERNAFIFFGKKDSLFNNVSPANSRLPRHLSRS